MKRTQHTRFCSFELKMPFVLEKVARDKRFAAWLTDTHDGQMRRKDPKQLKIDQHNARAVRNIRRRPSPRRTPARPFMKRPISRTRRNTLIVADVLGALAGLGLCYVLFHL